MTSDQTARWLAFVASAFAVVGVAATLVFFIEAYLFGQVQPWGTYDDASAVLFMAVFIPLVLEIRAAGWYQSSAGRETPHFLGLFAGATALIGSIFTLGSELSLRGFGSWGGTIGLAMQELGFAGLIAWCLWSGYLLGKASVPNAFAWGIVGATFFGMPLWLAWLGRSVPRVSSS
ncbi:MAG: hypothetical protein L3J97_05405 [Thermoplasmata archaeon]|nr:hypothetical protein [Thermoplasmata archaeon]